MIRVRAFYLLESAGLKAQKSLTDLGFKPKIGPKVLTVDFEDDGNALIAPIVTALTYLVGNGLTAVHVNQVSDHGLGRFMGQLANFETN